MAMNETNKRRGRWVRIALGLSLAVNLLILGSFLGAFLVGGPSGRDKMSERRGGNVAIGIYGHALEKSDRRKIGKRLRQDRDSKKGDMRAELGKTTREATALLLQDPFDKDAFAALLQRQQGTIKGRSDQMQTALVEHVAAMSPEKRTAYAARLTEILDRGPRRK